MSAFDRSDIVVRLLNENDIEKIVSWTSGENWSLTEFDLKVFSACHPDDFFVAEVQGVPVGKSF